MDHARRRRHARGRWMRLRKPELLAQYMADNDFTQARLARYAGCSRQFIHLLIHEDRTTCTPEVAVRIEEAMRLLPGTLFDANESPTGRLSVKRPKASA